MNFKLWLNESNFTQITPEQRKSMDEITKYLKQLYATSNIDKLKEIVKDKDLMVGAVPIGDFGINGSVYVLLTKTPSEAFYDKSRNAIVFNVEWLKNNIDSERLARTFAHELGHGLDPKLSINSKYKYSDRYRKYLDRYYLHHDNSLPISDFESNPIHHVEPVEQDAEGTAIAEQIRKLFMQGNDDEKIIVLNDIEQFLKYKISTRAWGSDSNYHIKMLQTRPTAFKRFRKRLDSLYRDLFSKLTPEQKQNYYNTKNKPDETEALD
jgi:hypothetical protein